MTKAYLRWSVEVISPLQVFLFFICLFCFLSPHSALTALLVSRWWFPGLPTKPRPCQDPKLCCFLLLAEGPSAECWPAPSLASHLLVLCLVDALRNYTESHLSRHAWGHSEHPMLLPAACKAASWPWQILPLSLSAPSLDLQLPRLF